MERLTQTSSYGGVAFTFDLDITCQPSEARKILNLATKLKEYEDLEEQDRLIKLPCKVGDTVYVKMESYCKTHYAEAEVRDFVHFISCGFCAVVTSKYFDKENIPFSEFGKTVFLTKSEAEAKLKELRGGENGSME